MSIQKTPPIQVLQNIDKIKKGIGTIKELIIETYDLLINDQWSPNDANNYIKANCGLNPRTVEKALPDIAKDESKQHAGTKPVFKDSGEQGRQNSYIEEEKSTDKKDVNLTTKHNVVDLEPVTETQTEEPEPEGGYTVNLSYFKNIANGMDKFYFENLDYQQMQGKLSDLTFRGDRFDFAVQRRPKK